MNLSIFKLYSRVCKATNQKMTLEELNEFEKEIKENPEFLKKFNRKLKELGY